VAGNADVHILIVEHDPERRSRFSAALSGTSHQTEVADSATAALAALSRPAPPDLLVIQAGLEDMDPLDLLEAGAGIGPLPPVVFVGEDASAARWIEAASLGAVDYVVLDEEGAWLETLAARLDTTRSRGAGGERTRRMADALASTSAAVIIAGRGGDVQFANDACRRLVGAEPGGTPAEALAEYFADVDDSTAKADLGAAVRTASEWAGELQVRTSAGAPVPCIATVSPIRRGGGRLDGIVITLRDVTDRVAMEDALRAANVKLAEQAARDSLTGLYNRSYLHEVLDREVARSQRYGTVISVLMLDLDQFKNVNDEHGHPAGDAVLRTVAALLGPLLRDGDVLARFGGDEFCAVLPTTEEQAAVVVGERLRHAIAERSFGPAGGTSVRLSVGIATSTHLDADEEKPAEALLRWADRALYVSKGAGGDCVNVWAG
jgi:diguanylate cyclase (GGDEF)-like protein/PAS domain S-box-containing protein